MKNIESKKIIDSKEKNKINIKIVFKRIKKIMLSFAVVMVLLSIDAYASTFDNVTKEISNWAVKLGGLLALWGGIQIGLGFQSEDAGAKRRGVLELIGGLMVVAFAIGYKTIFGL